MIFKGLFDRFHHLGKGKRILFCLTVLLGLLIGLEIGLNLWLKSALEGAFLKTTRRGSLEQAGPGQIPAKQAPVKQSHDRQDVTGVAVNWLGLADLLSGRINWVRIRVRHCVIGPLEYAALNIDNNGFVFDLPLFVREKRLVILGIRRTNVRAVIEAASLQGYLNTYYPQFRPQIKIYAHRIQFKGVAKVFGAALPFQLEGDLRLSGSKGLRFFPTTLSLAGRPVSGYLLQLVSEQVPLQFAVLENWPLQITGFSLKDGYMTVDLREDDTANRIGSSLFQPDLFVNTTKNQKH